MESKASFLPSPFRTSNSIMMPLPPYNGKWNGDRQKGKKKKGEESSQFSPLPNLVSFLLPVSCGVSLHNARIEVAEYILYNDAV